MPDIHGLSRALQLALINILALLLASPDLDDDVARRAQWLKWKLDGFDPAAAAAERRVEWLKSTPAA